jgi:hypothetical protein
VRRELRNYEDENEYVMQFRHFIVQAEIIKPLLVFGFIGQSLTGQLCRSDLTTDECRVHPFSVETTLSQVIGFSDRVEIK